MNIELNPKELDTTISFVRVPAGFGCDELMVSETPITTLQYWSVMDKPNTFDTDILDTLLTTPNTPIVNVSYYDAVAFCEQMTKLNNNVFRFRLPTEIEQARCFGLEPKNLEDYAVYNVDHITDVKTKLPNELGLYDTRGLVWEWTTSDEDDDDNKFVRGGSWFDFQLFARAVFRSNLRPAYRDLDVGFRVVFNPNE